VTRDEALARLREQVAQGRPVIGAGAGTGLSAKCAQDGGADLIIIYTPDATGWRGAARWRG